MSIAIIDSTLETKLYEEVKRAADKGMLYLSHYRLFAFPKALFLASLNTPTSTHTITCWTNLTRLDLSYNHIEHIPEDIVLLAKLKELWINNNPLQEVPACIDKLKKLEVLDIRMTPIGSLPSNIAEMKRLQEIDWRETPLEKHLLEFYQVPSNDLPGLKKAFHAIHERESQKAILTEKFVSTHFLKESDNPALGSVISGIVEVLLC